jgi:hypothetical protein
MFGRSGASILASLAIAVLLAGCGANPSPSAGQGTQKPTPTVPTHSPGNRPTNIELARACGDGYPIPEAAEYAGAVHPLVIVLRDDVSDWRIDQPLITNNAPKYGIDTRWADDSWPGPIQLVVCLDQTGSVEAGSCGMALYRGVTGQVVQYKYVDAIRVVVASTGRTLQSDTLYGSVVACDSTWRIYGDHPDQQVNAYATSVSTQPVE